MSAHITWDRDFVVTVVPAPDAPASRVQALGRALETWSTRQVHDGLLRWVDSLALLDLYQGWDFPCVTFPDGGTAVLTEVEFIVCGDRPNARRRVLSSLRTIASDFADVLRAIDIDGVSSGLV